MTMHDVHEYVRLESLCRLAILDTPPEERFDRLTAIAAAAFGAPIALVSLVDAERQWFKSRHGLAATETPRSMAFCSHAIEGRATFVVADTHLDPLFADNPLVTGAPHIRFYAGHPVLADDGEAVGTLCVIDTVPRAFDTAQRAMLKSLAEMVQTELNRDALIAARSEAERALRELNADLERRIAERTAALRENNEALSREIRQRSEIEASLRASVAERLEAQRALEQKQQLLDAVLETVDVGVVACDADGQLSFFNHAALELHGQAPSRLAAADWAERYDLFHADGVTRMAAHEIPLVRALAGDTVRDVKMVIAPRGMRQRTLLASGRRLVGRAGERLGAVVAMKDISDLNESQVKLRENEQRLRTITNNVPVLISYLDTDLRFCFANAMYKDWLGVRSEDMVGRSIVEVFGAAYYEERAASLKLALAGHMSNLETRVVRKGQVRVLSTTYIPQLRDGVTVGIYVLATDATASRAHESRLMLLVNADPLTGLPNRRMYEEQLSVALARSRRHEGGLALMYLDLDNFKHINDSLGHAAGDTVLIEFGKRIKAVLREADMLARLAGDEFTVVLQAVDSPADCAVVATKMLAALAAPFIVQGQPLTISASIGVALAARTSTALSLASSADASLYAAKRAGKSRFNIVAEAAHTAAASLQ